MNNILKENEYQLQQNKFSKLSLESSNKMNALRDHMHSVSNVLFVSAKDTDELAPINPFINACGNSDAKFIHKFNMTAELARHMLEHFNNNKAGGHINRGIRKPNVAKLLKELENDEWQPNANLFCFDSDTGMILDGQHRLSAIMQYGMQKTPNDLSKTSVPINVMVTVDPDIRQNIDKNSPRTLAQTAVIMGLLDEGDFSGKQALTIVQALLQKLDEGNGFDNDVTHSEVYKNMLNDYAKLEEEWLTYLEVTREIIDGGKNSPLSFRLGHQVALALMYKKNVEEARRFLFLITMDQQAQSEYEKENPIDWESDEMTSVKRARLMLGELQTQSRKNGNSGGSARIQHFSYMLYLCDQFLKKKVTSKLLVRTLTTDSTNKSPKVVCWFPEEEESIVQKLLNLTKRD